MSDISISIGKEDNLKEIIEIFNECVGDENPSVAYENQIDINNPPLWLLNKIKSNSILIETANTEIRGFAQIGDFLLAPSVEEFSQLGVYVKRKYRRSLIGARLIMSIIHLAFTKQKTKIFSFVLANNRSSLLATARLFRPVGVLEKIAFIRNEFSDIHLFERDLTDGFNLQESHFFSNHVETYLNIKEISNEI